MDLSIFGEIPEEQEASNAELMDEQCNSIINRLAKKHNIDPLLITTRLMDETDKQEMRQGLTSENLLDTHIKRWIEFDMPDFAHSTNLREVVTCDSCKHFTKNQNGDKTAIGTCGLGKLHTNHTGSQLVLYGHAKRYCLQYSKYQS